MSCLCSTPAVEKGIWLEPAIHEILCNSKNVKLIGTSRCFGELVARASEILSLLNVSKEC